MELHRIYGEFDTEELAELAAGRIRRTVRGIRRMTICRLSHSMKPINGRIRFTMLPANLQMTTFAVDVMNPEATARAIPEPCLRKDAELMIVCDETSVHRVESLLHAAGAMRVRHG
ncbi:MAG: hypothetical protein II916_07410 [Oscillospiraceae bacterium]|nr:hypothetical protein [Oscillospiraceae bacterium]